MAILIRKAGLKQRCETTTQLNANTAYIQEAMRCEAMRYLSSLSLLHSSHTPLNLSSSLSSPRPRLFSILAVMTKTLTSLSHAELKFMSTPYPPLASHPIPSHDELMVVFQSYIS